VGSERGLYRLAQRSHREPPTIEDVP
jgi:hypothetical protein